MTQVIEMGSRTRMQSAQGRVPASAACETAELLDWLPRIHALGGPRVWLYEALHRWVHEVARNLRSGTISRAELDARILALGSPYLERTILGHVFMRPYGYAGDFETIEAFYRTAISDDPRCVRWDEFTQSQPAARAVRNRKEYFKELVKSVARRNGGRLHVLDLGSGPCRDVAEFLSENLDLDVRFTCVDQDRHAILHAASLCARYPERVEFVRANVFKFQRRSTFGLVWSAGVTDYLDPRSAASFLGLALSSAVPGGEVVIGNFSPDNPNRDHIEVMSRWYLHHRTPRELLAVAEGAGLALAGLRIGMESEGINLFLHAQRKA